MRRSVDTQLSESTKRMIAVEPEVCSGRSQVFISAPVVAGVVVERLRFLLVSDSDGGGAGGEDEEGVCSK
jgi:hypothetical protein